MKEAFFLKKKQGENNIGFVLWLYVKIYIYLFKGINI